MSTRSTWLCPVKMRNWQVARKNGIFGFPRYARRALSNLEVEDNLIFYALRPTDRVVAIGQVTSDVYESAQKIWPTALYPLRINFRVTKDLTRSIRGPIRLHSIIGDTRKGDVEISPYLRNTWIAKIAYKQYLNLMKHMQ